MWSFWYEITRFLEVGNSVTFLTNIAVGQTKRICGPIPWVASLHTLPQGPLAGGGGGAVGL